MPAAAGDEVTESEEADITEYLHALYTKHGCSLNNSPTTVPSLDGYLPHWLVVTPESLQSPGMKKQAVWDGLSTDSSQAGALERLRSTTDRPNPHALSAVWRLRAGSEAFSCKRCGIRRRQPPANRAVQAPSHSGNPHRLQAFCSVQGVIGFWLLRTDYCDACAVL